MRRLDLTTIFSNPGSTEVPFLAGMPEDLTLRAGAARRLRRGDGGRVRDRPRCPGPGVAALDAGLGQRGRRAGDGAHQSRSAGRAGRPAGPPPPRARAVPGRPSAGPGRRVSGVERPARAPAGRAGRDRPRLPRGGDRPRPRDRRGADGRLAGAGARAARDLRAPAAAAYSRRRLGGDRGAGGAAVGGALARDRRRRGRRQPGRLGRAARARGAPVVPGLPGAVRRRRGLPAGPSAVRRPPAGAPRTAARGARSVRRRARRRDRRVAPVPVRRRAAGATTGRAWPW